VPPQSFPLSKDGGGGGGGGGAEGKGPIADKALPHLKIDFEQRQHLAPAGFAAVSVANVLRMGCEWVANVLLMCCECVANVGICCCKCLAP